MTGTEKAKKASGESLKGARILVSKHRILCEDGGGNQGRGVR